MANATTRSGVSETYQLALDVLMEVEEQVFEEHKECPLEPLQTTAEVTNRLLAMLVVRLEELCESTNSLLEDK